MVVSPACNERENPHRDQCIFSLCLDCFLLADFYPSELKKRTKRKTVLFWTLNPHITGLQTSYRELSKESVLSTRPLKTNSRNNEPNQKSASYWNNSPPPCPFIYFRDWLWKIAWFRCFNFDKCFGWVLEELRSQNHEATTVAAGHFTKNRLNPSR